GGRHFPLAATRDESVVQYDVVHRPGPYQERVRGVGGPLVAMAAAFHNQAQVMVAREVDACYDLSGVARLHRKNAGCWRPGIQPAGNFGPRRLIANVEGIANVGADVLARRATWLALARVEERLHLDEIAADRVVE